MANIKYFGYVFNILYSQLFKLNTILVVVSSFMLFKIPCVQKKKMLFKIPSIANSL